MEVAESLKACSMSTLPTSLQWGRDLEVAERVENVRPLDGDPVMLQWGRDLEVAESRVFLDKLVRLLVLQWGRDLEVAERSPSQLLF